MPTKTLYNVDDIRFFLDCGRTKAYRVIKNLNDELVAAGSNIEAGKVPSLYFHQRYKGYLENEK